MKYEIRGNDIQAAVVELNKDEFVQAEAGSMFFMEGDVEMDLRTPGGWVGGLKRMFVGESFMIPIFKAKGEFCKVAFAAPYPGKILELEVTKGNSWQAQKDSFLFAIGQISINVAFIKKFRVGFFGGEGFVLEKFSGEGKAFINCSGLAIQKTLSENETIQIDTGCVVAFEESVTYDVKRIKSLKTAFLGGEGLFLSTLTGPGKIILQSLPLSRFRSVIFGRGNNAGILGDVGRVFGGD